MRFVTLLLGVLLLAGCQFSKTPGDVGYPVGDSALEISKNPMILATQQDKWNEMTLYGIRIGDAQSVLPKKQIREEINGGWIVMRNGNRFLSGNNDHIDALGVFEPELLEKLGIEAESDIAKVFGPKSVPVKPNIGDTIYYFQDRHIRVVWNLVEKKVVAVNVWK